MRRLKSVIDQLTNFVIDLILTVLAIFMIIAMVKQLMMLGTRVFASMNQGAFEIIIQGSLSFFMYFEFTMMIKKYIDEDHHIPIRYLVYIAITAILRQEMVVHNNAFQTLILSVAIFLLVVTLILIQMGDHELIFWHGNVKKSQTDKSDTVSEKQNK